MAAIRPLLLVLVLLLPLAAGARETTRPSGSRILDGLASRWGARNIKDSALPPLTFEKFGYLTPQGARSIRGFVSALRTGADQVVLLRGQKRLHPRVSRLPADRTAWPGKVADAVRVAQSYRSRKLADMAHHDTFARAVGCTRAHEQHKRYFREAGPLDLLVERHQTSSGSPLFVSATRSLSVAAGDYNMRTSDNRNRYIYVLLAPRKRCVNIHGLDKLKGEMFMSAAGMKKHGNVRIKEREIAVWLDATDCVSGVYDAVQDKFVPGRRP